MYSSSWWFNFVLHHLRLMVFVVFLAGGSAWDFLGVIFWSVFEDNLTLLNSLRIYDHVSFRLRISLPTLAFFMSISAAIIASVAWLSKVQWLHSIVSHLFVDLGSISRHIVLPAWECAIILTDRMKSLICFFIITNFMIFNAHHTSLQIQLWHS